MAPTFLGIESSCDDTAAAVVRGDGTILSSVVAGQTALHADFGGVVPEIAARAHAEKLDLCVEQALEQAGVTLDALDGIAVTAGPGLIGGVLSGVMLAKGLAAGSGLPLVGVNHLAGHALTPRLTDGVGFPYLTLLVSGGHCQFLLVRGAQDFTRLGGTIDDAPGEAFDKVAKLLGLPQPGGPSVEAAAQGGLHEQDRRDICAGFQAAVAEVLAEKTRRALEQTQVPVLAVAGGVAANQTLRSALMAVAEAAGARFLAPPLRLCTDNAAMIAWAGIEAFRAGQRDGMDLAARPRWPLDSAAAPMLGTGKRGAKA